jgi:HEAT repeat protein
MLSNQDARQRARAAEAIGSLGSNGRPAVDFLDRALRDREARVRSSAALALANVTQGTDLAVRGLKRALKDKDADVRYSAAAGLGRIGTEAGRQAFLNHMRREAVHLMLTPAPLKGEEDSGRR